MQCVVLAGGLGTRLGQLTLDVPKTLVSVAGRPFADYQLELLARQSISRVTYCIGHLGKPIRDHVSDGSRFGLSVDYVDEGDILLGTAGALRLAFDQGRLSESFFVTYGDSYLPISFADVWRAAEVARPDALMTVLENEGKWDASNVIYKDGRVQLYEKGCANAPAIGMNWIDYGLLVLRKQLVDTGIPPGKRVDLGAFCNRLSLDGRLAGYEVRQRFYEIGTLRGLADFETWIVQAADNEELGAVQ
jgi:NDP-sugar pyrophosphorylase family protein